MAYLADAYLDDLSALAGAATLVLSSADPGGTYGSIASLGSASVTLTGPGDVTGGRGITCPETVVTPSGTGDVTHWAITNGTDTILASGAFASTVAVVDTVDKTIGAFVVATALDAVSA